MIHKKKMKVTLFFEKNIIEKKHGTKVCY